MPFRLQFHMIVLHVAIVSTSVVLFFIAWTCSNRNSADTFLIPRMQTEAIDGEGGFVTVPRYNVAAGHGRAVCEGLPSRCVTLNAFLFSLPYRRRNLAHSASESSS